MGPDGYTSDYSDQVYKFKPDCYPLETVSIGSYFCAFPA